MSSAALKYYLAYQTCDGIMNIVRPEFSLDLTSANPKPNGQGFINIDTLATIVYWIHKRGLILGQIDETNVLVDSNGATNLILPYSISFEAVDKSPVRYYYLNEECSARNDIFRLAIFQCLLLDKNFARFQYDEKRFRKENYNARGEFMGAPNGMSAFWTSAMHLDPKKRPKLKKLPIIESTVVLPLIPRPGGTLPNNAILYILDNLKNLGMPTSCLVIAYDFLIRLDNDDILFTGGINNLVAVAENLLAAFYDSTPAAATISYTLYFSNPNRDPSLGPTRQFKTYIRHEEQNELLARVDNGTKFMNALKFIDSKTGIAFTSMTLTYLNAYLDRYANATFADRGDGHIYVGY